MRVVFEGVLKSRAGSDTGFTVYLIEIAKKFLVFSKRLHLPLASLVPGSRHQVHFGP